MDDEIKKYKKNGAPSNPKNDYQSSYNETSDKRDKIVKKKIDDNKSKKAFFRKNEEEGGDTAKELSINEKDIHMKENPTNGMSKFKSDQIKRNNFVVKKNKDPNGSIVQVSENEFDDDGNCLFKFSETSSDLR